MTVIKNTAENSNVDKGQFCEIRVTHFALNPEYSDQIDKSRAIDGICSSEELL
ncbi:MAG: hypothetical protein A4E53_01588 [Pelotomaculum sp. PtaB.Bin104]|nr:MAG: hypothetical protein A4E53_01588 [Pelotomaculum sp. PtaB.Bin104]